MKGRRAALYLRLSRDDEGAGESESITNQRALLTAYAREHSYIVAGEYVDDGWSGLDFDRPALRRLLSDVDAGKLDVVLVKDLSRLGRDYIRTGELTELYFPARRVRCIAVNDGFDSARSEGSDLAPLRNVLNEMYARDTSRKIRSALSAKRVRGAYLSSFAPYGYRKDPTDKNHLLPDGEAAEVVRAIFARAAAGEGPGEIARALNHRGLSPPGHYRQTGRLLGGGEGTGWTASTVSKLLGNRTYLGCTVQGKTARPSFKAKASLSKPPEEWVVVEGTHTPLVSRACFEEAARRRRSRTCRGEGGFRNRFSGLARCADCGHGMSSVGTRRKGSAADLACGAYKLQGSGACTNHFIGYEVLEALVGEEARRVLTLPEAERAELARRLGERWDREAGARREAPDRLRREAERTEGLIQNLYEDRQSGALEEGRFYALLERYQARAKELRERLAALEGGEAAAAADRTAFLTRALEELDAWARREELEEDVLFGLLDRVEVGQGSYAGAGRAREKRQRVELFFRFQVPEAEREVLL